METVTAKQLHQQTKDILDQLEKGESLIITRNGFPLARMEPLSQKPVPPWDDLMAEIWRAQAQIRDSERRPNPVLEERQRRRR